MQISESRISFATRATLFFLARQRIESKPDLQSLMCNFKQCINKKGAYVIREKKRKEEVIKLINFNI